MKVQLLTCTRQRKNNLYLALYVVAIIHKMATIMR
jgi:hypothetical protein